MIFTDRVITVRKGESKINEPIIVYRGDYELEVRFTIMNSKFKFMSGTNLIESENAAYGQLAILTPYGGNIFSEVATCNEGTVTFVLSKAMLDQIEEVGLYSFQIRLFDYIKESRVSIPPVEFGIEVREPITSEDHDNSVNNAIVGYSIAKVVDPSIKDVGPTFDNNGNYNKTDWETGDRISEGKLNKIEDAIDTINKNEKSDVATLDKRITNNFNVVSNRIDSLTKLQDGSTTGDAELIDARIEYDGEVSNTVGEAIRKQIGDIHDMLDVVINERNLYSTAPVVHGKYFVSGEETNSSKYSYFKVDVKAGTTYYMYPRIRLYCLMDYDGQIVSQNTEDANTDAMYSYTPSADGFLYVTIYYNDLDSAKMATTSDMDSVGNYGEAFTMSDNIRMFDHKDIIDIYGHIDSFFIYNNLLNDALYYPGYFHREGHAVADSDYSYFVIDLEPGTEYVIYPRCRMIDWYNTDNTYIEIDESMNGQNGEVVITVPDRNNISTAYITIYSSDISNIRLYKNDGRSYKDISVFNSVILNDNVDITKNDAVIDIYNEIEGVKSYVIDNNLLTHSECVDGYYFNSLSSITPSSSYCYYKVNLKANVTYYMYPRIRIIRAYRKDTDISILFSDTDCNNGEPYVFTPSVDCDAYVTFYATDKYDAFISEESDPSLVPKTGYRLLTKDIEKSYVIDNNLLTHSKCVDGHYFNSFSNIQTSSNYCYYKVILKANVTYYMYPRIRIIRAYKKDTKTSILFDNTDNGKPYVFTPSVDCDTYVTFYATDKYDAFISEESDPSLVPKTGCRLLAKDIEIDNIGNVLYRKKWAVIGDSFTAGDFEGYTDANGLSGQNSPELYDEELGMFKTYPWWIMKRNNMTLQKFYEGGRTLATPADGTFTNSITYNDMYKQIDADVDYITIYLGINDGHHMPGSTGDDGEDTSGAIPLGTETDETTTTFYGAWNVLLRDLITLYPFAHIGILVSNGMDTDDHVNATIKMAKKWGIPYLNLDSGYDVPLLLRSRPNCRPETCAEAISIRNSQQRVSSGNSHPNHLTHKYESTFIEAFLRRI